jgi:hypothetical protein
MITAARRRQLKKPMTKMSEAEQIAYLAIAADATMANLDTAVSELAFLLKLMGETRTK